MCLIIILFKEILIDLTTINCADVCIFFFPIELENIDLLEKLKNKPSDIRRTLDFSTITYYCCLESFFVRFTGASSFASHSYHFPAKV